ncbi:MAG: AAA+ family ATPase, partial [Armatimonadota bacterium]|nr:AAA+ family ATPase [Armatimonadota bacterium]
GTRLRMELDRVPLWRGDHVSVSQLIEDFARYLYLPRLKSPAVLVEAVRDGVSLLTWEQEAFAYADGFDEAAGRYRGLRAGQQVAIATEAPQGLVVKPEAAKRQMDTAGPPGPPSHGGGTVEGPTGAGPVTGPRPPAPSRLPTRFHGTVSLDPVRAGAEAGRIAQEILTHLVNVPGARVQVILEIEAVAPEGVPENVVRTVTENARTLRFRSHGFERE